MVCVCTHCFKDRIGTDVMANKSPGFFFSCGLANRLTVKKYADNLLFEGDCCNYYRSLIIGILGEPL